MSEPAPPWPPGSKEPFPDDDQKIFDTVVGPNLRLRDNLIQLAAIVAGSALGSGAGAVYARISGNDLGAGVVLGGVAGLLLSLFLSGLVIGLVRAILALKR